MFKSTVVKQCFYGPEQPVFTEKETAVKWWHSWYHVTIYISLLADYIDILVDLSHMTHFMNWRSAILIVRGISNAIILHYQKCYFQYERLKKNQNISNYRLEKMTKSIYNVNKLNIPLKIYNLITFPRNRYKIVYCLLLGIALNMYHASCSQSNKKIFDCDQCKYWLSSQISFRYA